MVQISLLQNVSNQLQTYDVYHPNTAKASNQEGPKMNGTHQLLDNDDGVKVMDENTHTIKKYTEALLVASKEAGLYVNAEKTKPHLINRI
jgi:hypothetical protein